MTARGNALLLGLAALILAVPLIFNPSAPFGGTDAAASELVAASNPQYQRWTAPLWQPPGKELEGTLFALQAAFGAGILGYVIGRRRGRPDQ